VSDLSSARTLMALNPDQTAFNRVGCKLFLGGRALQTLGRSYRVETNGAPAGLPGAGRLGGVIWCSWQV